MVSVAMRMTARVLVALLASGGSLEGQDSRGVGLQFSVGSMGGGIQGAGALSPRLGLRGGLHAMPRSFETRFGGLDYTVAFPSPLLLLGVDAHPTGGGLRVSTGVLILLDQVFLETGDILMEQGPDDVAVGANLYPSRRVGRLEARAEGRSTVPWFGVGWGGNPSRGRVEFWVDAGVALWGSPRVRLEVMGAERGNPVFQMDVEQERLAMEARFGDFSVYPLLMAGVSLPIFGSRMPGSPGRP